MKLKILILVATAAVFASCGPSYRVTDQSKTTGTSAPTSVQTSFNTQYPAATEVVWAPYDANTVPIDWDLSGWSAMDNTGYVATFTLNNDQYYAWYDASGNWIGSTYNIHDFTTLPSAVSSMISGNFPGYTVTSVNSEMQKDKTAYEIQLKNGDSKSKLLVDADGNIIKQKTVTK
jgi:hypothetical protein